MPYWTPISPWLFILYTALNWKDLRIMERRGLAFAALPVVFLLISCYGWVTVGFRPDTVWLTVAGLSGASACLLSLYIGYSLKRIAPDKALNILIAGYVISFAIGVVEFITIRGHIALLADFFKMLLERQYISGEASAGYNRVQFLFAEPSYIGMHLFGVLLPLYWLTRKRRLLVLILVYASWSIIMGSGVRILLDCVIAVSVSCIVLTDWRAFASRLVATVLSLGVIVMLIVVGIFNPRIQAVFSNGLFSADQSTAARLLRFLIPIEAGLHDPPHLLFGFGAGNIYDSFGAGMSNGLRAFQQLNHGVPYLSYREWTDVQHLSTPHNMFTMSAYSSLLAEFGLLGIALLATAIILAVSIQHAWNPMTVAWLLLIVYLYLQFEGYAFYALPLFVWSVLTGRSLPTSATATAEIQTDNERTSFK